METQSLPSDFLPIIFQVIVALGFAYSTSDKAKATDLFNKALALDPANANATTGLKQLTAPAAKAAPKKK